MRVALCKFVYCDFHVGVPIKLANKHSDDLGMRASSRLVSGMFQACFRVRACDACDAKLCESARGNDVSIAGVSTVNSGPWARAWGVGVPLVVEQDLAVTISDDECLRELWKHL